MKVARKLWTWALALVATFAVVLGLSTVAMAAAGDTPPHTKNITDNQDGTYTISLDIVGESEKKPNNVNVIVIFDTSGSMNTTRMNAAKNAVNSLANSLYAYNTTENPNTVEMALVQFATSSTIAQNPTTSQTTFTGAVNGLGNAQGAGSGGTNWESALQTALNVDFGDEDQTFVVFVSDGNPTFRTTQNGWNDWSQRYQQWGTGEETTQNIQRCYTTAVDDAQALATKVTPANFFTIGAFGNVDRMEQLTDDAGSDSSTNYYSAQNTAALNQAIADILAKIEMAGFADAEIDDGTTSQVTTTSGEVANLLVVDESSYKYYRSGGSYGSMQTWTDAPAAHLVDGTVEWDLSSVGVLENGVKYTVTFDCYPSQTTYDIIAQLKNGDLKYSELDSEIQKYIDDNGGGSYSLRTNTNAGIAWDDTRDDAGPQTSAYKNPDPVKTESSTLTATKEWEGGEPDVDSLEITVLMDDKPFHSAKISKDNGWSTSSFISPGIIKNNQVLPGAEGHDFKFAELGSEQYHWELESPVVHPMLIDGTLTMLIKVDKDHPQPSGATTYTINGATYYVDSSAAGLTAVNHRRSNLNLTKVVTGEDAPKDATFPFTLTVNNSKAANGSADDTDSDYYVWFSIYDTKAGAPVMDATVTGATGPNADGFYYAPSGSAITVQMKDSWNLRFTNLPSGTTYTFAEGALPEGFAFNKAELTQGEDSTFSGAQTTTGTIENTKTSYAVTYTNDYQLTDLEITKVWSDANNQDGIRLTAAQLADKLTLSPAVQGKTPTVTDNGDGTYTITYTGLPRFSNGQEVEYKVTESAIDGYTTTGSPAKDHGTITNKHTPEVTSVKVTKVWDDSNDAGKIRPTSVSVQLTADGVASGDPVTLNEGNEWTYTWENLPKYKNGTAIVYAADETEVPTGYTKTVTGDAATGITITNKYTPTPITASFPVKKTISVPDGLTGPTTWSYTINVTANNGAPEAETMSGTVSNTADTVNFGDFTFTMPGTYTYTVAESGTVDGVTNDTDAAGKTVTITVVDDGTGKLTASVEPAAGITFTNTYGVEPTTASFPVEKILSVKAGLNAPDITNEYTITLAAVDGAPMPETTSYTNPEKDGGTVTFGTISYDKPGTYTYTVTESGDVAGVTNDTAAETGKTITVTVVDNGDGTLTATPSTDETPVSFTNTYQVGEISVSIPVKKEVEFDESLKGPEDWTYTITAEPVDGAPVADEMETTVTKASPSSSIGMFTFTEPGTYTYTVTETGTVAGVTNGTDSYDVDIVVTDNGDGSLSAVVNNDALVLFTNTYNVDPVTASFPVKKTLDVPAGLEGPEEWSYDITVNAEGGAPEAETMNGTVDQDNSSITFGEFTFNEPGTYTYTVSESGTVDGVTNDTDAAGKTVTITVVDNQDGTLSASVSPEVGISFTNTYDVQPTTASFPVAKIISVPEGMEGPEEWSYDISVTANGDAPSASVMSGAVNQDSTSITFGPITYDKPGTYTYTVTESGSVDGVTNDPETSKTVTVTVEDDGEGGLTASVSPETGITFNNTYNASGEATITVSKALAGAAWPEGKTLTLTLAAEGDAPLPETTTATLSATGSVSFGPISYSAPGTYTYTVSEDGFGAGWTGSGDITVTVKVEDKGDGTLVATPSYSPSATITNTYKATGSVNLGAKKVLTGREWADVDTYTFTLYGNDGSKIEDVTVTAENKDNVAFSTINYTEADAGKTYTYTISETGTLPANVTKSADVTAKVTITDNGDGTLATSVVYTPEDQTIINTYVPTSVNASITVNKTIDEYIEGSDKTFNFTMTPIDGAPMPEGKTELTASITTEDGKGSVTLDPITYTAAGTYQYKVVEKDEATAGWTYDTKEYTVTVTVTDDPATGKLSAEVTYGGEATAVDVHNLFEEESTSVKLHVDKVIDDQSASAEDATFTFVLTPGEGAPGETQTIEITTNGLKGGADFAPIEFTESGTFNYTIQETGTAPSGWTYDTKAYPVVITVSDNFETAILESATTIDGETATSLTITNVYKAGSTKSSLQVTKAIEDTSESAPDVTFEFTLATTDGSPMPDPATATVTGAGTATFGEVEYTKAGEYHYTITETKGGDAGWTNDTTTYPVVVTVTDNEGQLVATAAYGEKSETSLTVTNIYDPEDAKATPKALKTIDDQSNSAPSETFTFQLIDSKGNVVETKTRENGGPVEFTELTFAKVGTYEYTIKEVAGSTKGYTYDTADHSVTIKVEDKGDGNLEATITYADGEQATIKNVYKAEPVEVKLEGEKVLEGGKKLEAGEFTFELTDNDGNKVDGTFTNDADGNIDFGSYTFEKAGTYTYTAKEAKGDNEHMTYDSGEHTFVITVTDEGGTLKAEVTSDDGAKAKFTNTYTPEPVSIDPPVQKVITGDKPASPATFTFQMKAITEGAPMPAGSSDGIKSMQITGAGSKEFGEIVYTEPGEWVYEISELKGNAEGYTYDTTVYTLTVKVTQNDDGTLTKTETIKGGDAIVFTNKYEAPKTPKTGDTTPQVGMLALAGVIIAGIGAFGARRRED